MVTCMTSPVISVVGLQEMTGEEDTEEGSVGEEEGVISEAGDGETSEAEGGEVETSVVEEEGRCCKVSNV